MGLFNAISAWNTARYEKHVSNMQSKGYCPDCYGRGYSSYAPHEYFYSNVYECPGCNGSGKYSNWAESNGKM